MLSLSPGAHKVMKLAGNGYIVVCDLVQFRLCFVTTYSLHLQVLEYSLLKVTLNTKVSPFYQNVGELLPDCTASQTGRHYISVTTARVSKVA